MPKLSPQRTQRAQRNAYLGWKSVFFLYRGARERYGARKILDLELDFFRLRGDASYSE
jgi:hypothetical protein